MIAHRIPDDRIPGGEQASAPVEDKQTVTPPAGQSGLSAALPRRWIDRALSLLGVLLPMVAGALVSWPWGGGALFDAVWVFGTVVLGMVLSPDSAARFLPSTCALRLA